MNFDSFVFPVPSCDYNEFSYPDQLLWIPKKNFTYKDKIKYSINSNSSKIHSISCLKIQPSKINDNNENKKAEDSDTTEIEQENVENSYISESNNEQKKERNSFINKIPSITFQIDNKFRDTEIMQESKIMEYIPCLFLKAKRPCERIIIYFHSNYEDLGSTFPLCSYISDKLNINLLSIEFPKYGIYKSKESTSETLLINDANLIFNFLTEILEIKEENIIIIGRCVGSGPATYLASRHNILALILISPFKSIKEAVRTMFPKLHLGTFLQSLVKERFNNYDIIRQVTSPILFIHGKMDKIIPYEHSIELIAQCTAPAKMVSPHYMSHNKFDFEEDLVVHIKEFLKVFTFIYEEYNFDVSSEDLEDTLNMEEGIKNTENIIFPSELFKCPYSIK